MDGSVSLSDFLRSPSSRKKAGNIESPHGRASGTLELFAGKPKRQQVEIRLVEIKVKYTE